MGLVYVLFSTTFSSDSELENKLLASAVVPNRAECSYDMGSSEDCTALSSVPMVCLGLLVTQSSAEGKGRTGNMTTIPRERL